eukprot:gnl/TRDRNA2_/TRDRNA2_178646_c0_seq1.p1 gnl/TRDRNA2_/TRDRNA2_178646_c0~~gnl/TRDRNA2_/TRDRNA2_178646_c0_seq1.p1  ORF type:complete len:696 (-),score=159.59 gnl/TRDRNA2_/TRDRNA2_178646_c0_seq1:51-1898(-)
MAGFTSKASPDAAKRAKVSKGDKSSVQTSAPKRPSAAQSARLGIARVAPTDGAATAAYASRTLVGEELCDPSLVVPQIMHLARSNTDKVLDIYRSAMQAGINLNKVPQDDLHQLYLALVTAAVRAGHANEVSNLLCDLQKMGNGIDIALFSSAVKLCTSRHLFSESISIYNLVSKDPSFQIADKSLWSCLLFCAVESKDFDRCDFFFRRLKQHGAPSSKDYGNMIRFVSLQGNWEQSLALLSDMRSSGIEVDSVHYNTILATCVMAEQVDHAHALLGEMESAGGVTDVITYNTLMKGYAKTGSMTKCYELYKHMVEKGIVPSQVTYGILLDGFINENRLDFAEQIFQNMVADGVSMNTVLYTTVIKGFARAGKLDQAMIVYEQMRAGNVHPDLVTFSILIKAHCDASHLDTALALLQQMLELGLRPDEVVFNNLLTGCAQKANAELGKQLYQDMVASGLRPSNASFSILIRLYAQCKMLDEAVEMLAKEPGKYKVDPEPRLFVQLIQSCIRDRQGRRALEVYDMLVAHSKPTAAAHGSMLQTCVKLNMFDTAAEILAAAAKNHGRIDVSDANALLEAAQRKKKTQCAQECAASMLKMGLKIDPALAAQVEKTSKH